MQVCYPGRPGSRGNAPGQGVRGQIPPKNFLRVVHGKWFDRWEKWTVRLELLPTTLRPTEADTTHKMKLTNMSKNKTIISGIMRSGCDTIIGSSQCQPCRATCIALRWKPS